MSPEMVLMLLGCGLVVGVLARWMPASAPASLAAAVTPYAGFGLTFAFC